MTPDQIDTTFRSLEQGILDMLKDNDATTVTFELTPEGQVSTTIQHAGVSGLVYRAYGCSSAPYASFDIAEHEVWNVHTSTEESIRRLRQGSKQGART